MSPLRFRKRKFFWQKVRVGVVDLVRRVLLESPAGLLPAHWVRSVAGGYFRNSIQEHLMHAREVYPPVIAHYSFDTLYPIKFRRNKAFDAVHLYTFKDIWVSPLSALAFVPDDWVLEESAGSLEKILGWGKVLPHLMLKRERIIEQGPVLVVPAAPFYHFVWEHLPPIIKAIRYCPDVKLLLPSSVPRYVSDFLTLLLGESWEKRAINSDNLCQVPHLLVPQIESFSGFIHPEYPGVLLSAFSHCVADETAGVDSLYISRRKAPGRHMRHEAELEKGLIHLGFKILYLEELSILEQMKAFRRASIILAPHGAGLSHIHFCQPGTYLLEFFPDSYFNDCYARLAVSMGLEYDYITCKYDANWEGGMLPIDNILVRVKDYLRLHTPHPV